MTIIRVNAVEYSDEGKCKISRENNKPHHADSLMVFTTFSLFINQTQMNGP